MHRFARARALLAPFFWLWGAALLPGPASAQNAPSVHLGDAPGLYREVGWKPVATLDDGTRIATKVIPGSRVPAVRITMEVDVDSDAYLAVLTDRRRFARVASEMYVHDTAVLSRASTGESPYEDVYTYLRFPSYMPVQDREQVLRIWTLRDADAPGHHRMAWVAVPARHYAKKLSARGKDAVYMERSTGCWEMRPLPGGRTRVTYRSLSHPGGDFPDFLVSKTQEQQMPALMRALASEARKRADTASARPPRG